MAFPSTLADLKAEVIRNVRLNATADDSKVTDFVNQAYTRVCVDTEATFSYGTATLTAGTATYTMPSEISRIKEIVCLATTSTGNGAPLAETKLADILTLRQDGSSGTPTNYCL